MTPPNTDVHLTVIRGGKQQDVTVKLGEQPDERSEIAMGGHGNHGDNNADTANAESLGLRLSDVTDELTTKFNLPDTKGAVVTSVDPNSPAAVAEVEVGDVITKVGKTEVDDAASCADAIGKGDPTKGIALHLTDREGSRIVFIKSDQ
jgi:serine protease Do